MNFKNVKNLLYMNLMYSVPPSTLDKYRMKQKTKRININGVIIRQHIGLALVYVVLFGVGALTLNGDEGRFLTFVSVFSIFSVLQAILAIFNVFYESNDLEAYRPLPFSDLEVFVAKISVCTLNIIYFLAPIVLYCFFVQFNFHKPISLSILLGLFSSLFLVVTIMLVAINITYFLTKTPFFKRSKKVATALLSAVILVGTILMVVFMSSPAAMQNQEITSIAGKVPIFWLFFGLAKDPFASRTLIHLSAWLLFFAMQLIICAKIVIPNVYIEASSMQNLISSRKKKRLQKHGSSLKSSLLHYHLGFLWDSQVLLSFIIMPPLIYIIMIVPNLLLVQDELKYSMVTPNYIIVGVVFGMLYALLSAGAFSSIIISLDRENYSFIKSLPFDLKGYIAYKFIFSYVTQLIIPFFGMLIISAVLKLPILIIVSMLITYAITALPTSFRAIRKDHENLLLDWTNVVALAQRGGTKAVMMMKLFGLFIFGIVAVIAAVTLAQKACFTSIVVITSLLYVVLLIIVGTSYTKTKKYFNDNL